jgi:GTP-binding protein
VVPLDEEIARWLRGSDTPIVLACNKIEGRAGEQGVIEALALGFGDPVQLSAEHGEGIGDLFEALLPFLERGEGPEQEDEDESLDAPLKLAIVGRPNAGKSTLVNRMLGEERMITGPEAGITRDSISIDWDWRDPKGGTRPVRLIDTAGMRKRAKVQDKLEKLSVADALHAVDFAEVVVLLLDATLGLEAQDLRIADRVLEEGRALVIALSKWDIAENASSLFNGVKKALEDGLSQVKGVTVMTVSGATGKGIDQLIQAAFDTREAWSKRVGTGELNRWFERAIEANPPPAPGGKRIKMRYVTQVKTRPPSFVIFGTRVDQLPASYERYLVNSMRKELGFGAVPVRLTLRAPKNPFDVERSGNAKFTRRP